MTKWEDTVMTPEIRDSGKYWYDRYHGVRDVEAICKAQAEISFKVGREEGFTLAKVTDPVLLSKTEHEELNGRAKAFLDDVRLSGIKEVIDKGWVIEQDDEVRLEKGDFIIKNGQAKMKEWGI